MTIKNQIFYRMLEMWTNFIKFLDPTPDQQSNILGDIKWDPVNPKTHKHMRIDTELTMEMPQEYLFRMQFWRTAFEECKVLYP